MFRSLLYSAFALKGSQETKAFERESSDPVKHQSKRLLQIIKANADTVYGREHNFASIKTVSDFQNNVPINVYDSLQPYIDRMAKGEQCVLTVESPIMFASTSGTTGARKLIPVTRSYVKEFRRASVVSGYNLLKNYPGISRGVSLSVFSPAEDFRTAGGTPVGAITGRLYLEEPPLIKKYISPIPYDVFTIEDYESRYYTLLRCALMLPVSCIYTLNPSTIVLIGKRLELYADALIQDVSKGTLTPPGHVSETTKKSLSKFLVADPARAKRLIQLWSSGKFTPEYIWQELSLVCCWTRAAAAFYLQDFPKYYGSIPVSDITYGASEGRGTVWVGRDKQALALRSHFYEFVPEDQIELPKPQVLLADQLETGKNYYILFTTSGGLYRYNLNDIVKVVDWYNSTPLLEFQHKGGNISSFTGEKLTESQVTSAATQTVNASGVKLRFFTVIPEFRPEPHYQLWAELEPGHDGGDEELIQRIASTFDQQLKVCNDEYKTKRESKRLTPPVGRLLPVGTYEDLRRKLVASGVPDAQIKISHLNPKADIKKMIEEKLLAPVGG